MTLNKQKSNSYYLFSWLYKGQLLLLLTYSLNSKCHVALSTTDPHISKHDVADTSLAIFVRRHSYCVHRLGVCWRGGKLSFPHTHATSWTYVVEFTNYIV